MVVNVEQGASNPSIATLLRLSDALGIGLSALVDVERPGALQVSDAGQAPVLWRGPSRRRGAPGRRHRAAGRRRAVGLDARRPATSTAPRRTAPVRASCCSSSPGRCSSPSAAQTQLLGAGASARLAGDLPHGYANPGDEPARFCLTVFEPNVRGGR